MGSKSKLLRAGEDRISGLPDSILCHILSYLPTKYAVATSVLSSRWKHVWTSITNLCFDDSLCLEYKLTHNATNDGLTGFENFVNRVVVLSCPSDINKFSLYCRKFRDLDCFKFWVSTAIKRNVREMELYLREIELSESIYTCKTLEVLKLNTDVCIKTPPSGICFPSVKILRVRMRYPGSCLFERLISVFPVLEDLSVEARFVDNQLTQFNISSCILRRLTLIFEKIPNVYTENEVMIRAPNLECLHIKNQALISYNVQELHSLKEACIDISNGVEGRIQTDSVSKLLKGITKVKFLYLPAPTLRSTENSDGDCFLNYFPNLEVLILEMEKFGKLIAEGYGLVEPRSRPAFLLLHVKKIEMRGFKGDEDELELAKFLLKNGEVLKTMIVKSCRMISQEKLKLCQKLLIFERGSKTCQIEFI